MKRVLVVEDSAMVLRVIKHVLTGASDITPVYAASFSEARAILEHDTAPIFAALVDLNLPDAPNGEVVDYTLACHIPTIVLTGTFDEAKRAELLSKGVADYVTKENKFSYIYARKLLQRLVKNAAVPVLVVDADHSSRGQVRALLRLNLYQVYEAEDGAEAIRTLLENPDIRMMITANGLPRMSGCDLIQNLRGKYDKTDLVVIGIADEDGGLVARFIKSGANDVLRKPFEQEEFFCRINHNADMLEMIDTLRESANKDHLTGSWSRQYFFRRGERVLTQARERNTPVAAVLIELDNLSEIADLFGDQERDQAAISVAQTLNVSFNRFILARAQGYVFCGLMSGLDNARAVAYVEQVRQVIGSSPQNIHGKAFTVTLSAGVSNALEPNLDGLMEAAHQCLQRAKDAGGDLVFGDEVPFN